MIDLKNGLIYKSIITRENYRIIEIADETVRALNIKDGYIYTIPKEDLIEIDNEE